MPNKVKIVAVTSIKGGVGKTVSSGLLARHFTEVEGKNVIVVDLDPRGSITSLLTGLSIGKDDLSVSEVLMAAANKGNFEDVFNRAVFDTGLGKSKNWKDNGGRLILLPAKMNLRTVLAETHHSLLGAVIRALPIPDDVMVIIDTSDHEECIKAGISAADVVFTPIITSRGDIPSVFETLMNINMMQREREGGKPLLGGIIINHADDTQWENQYIHEYTRTLEEYRKESNLRCVSDDIFFYLKYTKLIKRSSNLDWPLRKDFYDFGTQLADIVHQA